MGDRHIFGDVGRIGLGADFKTIRGNGYFYVDKTPFIEHYLRDTVGVSLICRPRRFGKSLNMDTLRCFLTDQEDNRELFVGLAVESSNVWDKANSAPVFHFSFKELTAESYRYAIFDMASKYLEPYCPRLRASAFKSAVCGYLAERRRETDALRFLTDAVYEATGKKSHVFIDEYDKLLTDKAGSESHGEIREFLTYLFSAVFKDNPSLEKGLLTGVMRVSYEGLFSGLNNVSVFDVFRDSTYCHDFGITEEEMREIGGLSEIDAKGVRDWYNGFAIGGAKLYNIFSVSSYLKFRQFDIYWGNSGTMGAVAEAIRSGGPGAPARGVSGGQADDAASAGRLNTLVRIAAGEQATVPVAHMNEDMPRSEYSTGGTGGTG